MEGKIDGLLKAASALLEQVSGTPAPSLLSASPSPHLFNPFLTASFPVTTIPAIPSTSTAMDTATHLPTPTLKKRRHSEDVNALPQPYFELPKETKAVGVRIEIVQHPELARVSGMTASDKRPMHPPPIVKLLGCGNRNAVGVVCVVSLWSIDGNTNMSFGTKYLSEPVLEYIPCKSTGIQASKKAKYSVVPTPAYSRANAVMGSLISVPESLMDLENKRGLYFLYPDLAIRISGNYRLKFDLYDVTKMPFGAPPLASAFSNIFRVYNPKEFPGTVSATPLSRCFASQGMKIRLRQATNSSKSQDSEDTDE